jgi:hypothetical protein
MIEIDATLAGDSSVTADATVAYEATATMAGSSSESAGPTVALAATATMAGSSSESAGPTVALAATATMSGSSSEIASEVILKFATATMAGSSSEAQSASYSVSATSPANSTVTATANVEAAAASAMAGSSGMGIANPKSLITGSMQGVSSVGANPKLLKNATATMSASSSLGASPNYVRIDLTAVMAGGSDMSIDPLGEWGHDGYGNSPYGGAHPPYGLLSAEALTQTLVRVRYTAMFDPTFPGLFALSNYSITPSVTIHSIALESAQSVLLSTDPLTGPLYTVTISDARGYFSQPLNPGLASQEFFGIQSTPTMFAVATRKTRIRVVFSDVMLQNSALTDPSQYQLTDLNGTSIPILSVETEQVSDVRSTVLLLGADLVDERHYQVTTAPGIITASLLGLDPNTSAFQWVENALRTQIQISDFSGEVQNGLYGIHGGLVFFSPALQTAASNSIIQVEEVDVCTRAFDEYIPPQPLDPPVLTTYGLSSWTPGQWAGMDPIPYVPPIITLNSSAALWAAFPRMVDAKFEMTMPAPAPGGPDTFTTDHVAPPEDSICDITLSETWDLTRVSLLNVTSWRLFNNNTLYTDTPYTGAAASLSGFVVGVDPLMPLVVTISNSSPAVVSRVGHGRQIGDRVQFLTSGSLPSPLVSGIDYYVTASGFTANSFQISASQGGSALNTTTAGSGVHNLAVLIGTLTGLSGMSPVISVGGFLTLSGAGYTGNNGTFKIVSFLDPTSVQIVNPFGVAVSDPNILAITWVKPPGFITAAVLKSEGLANILPATPGFLTLTGLVGMAASDVGNTVTIYGAATPANNGSFLITSFISGSSVVISNPSGVAPDLNNGLIGWATAPAPIPPGNTTSRTYLEIFMDGEAGATGTANVLLASQATMAGSSSATASGTVL